MELTLQINPDIQLLKTLKENLLATFRKNKNIITSSEYFGGRPLFFFWSKK